MIALMGGRQPCLSDFGSRFHPPSWVRLANVCTSGVSPMSYLSVQVFTCEQCGNQQEVDIWKSLNASLDPEAKDQLISGELFAIECERCQASIRTAYPLLYHDMELQVMVWLGCPSPAGDSGLSPVMTGELGPLPLGGFPKGYRLRRVETENELREKVCIFDAGLDDRVMEFMKFYARESHEALSKGGGRVFFCPEKLRRESRDDLRFLCLFPDGGGATFELPFSSYELLAEKLSPYLPQEPCDQPEWLRVDETYMAEMAALGNAR